KISYPLFAVAPARGEKKTCAVCGPTVEKTDGAARRGKRLHPREPRGWEARGGKVSQPVEPESTSASISWGGARQPRTVRAGSRALVSRSRLRARVTFQR